MIVAMTMMVARVVAGGLAGLAGHVVLGMSLDVCVCAYVVPMCARMLCL